MADHAHSFPAQPALQGMAAHEATYRGFLNGSVALVIHCLYIVVALVCFRFVDNPLNLVLGFGGILLGLIAVLIGLRAGAKWGLSVGLLVIYGLIVANFVHMS